MLVSPAVNDDPVVTNPNLYRVVVENDRVRALEYRDVPGDRTAPHGHPDSVMITFSSLRRRLSSGDREADLELDAGLVHWLVAQEHTGENIGETETHVFFEELKEPRPVGSAEPRLGPVDG